MIYSISLTLYASKQGGVNCRVFIGFSVSLPYFVLLSSGVMSAWIYLRFYQRHSRGRGDLADHFSFASFFPRVFRVSLTDAVFKNMVFFIIKGYSRVLSALCLKLFIIFS